MQGLLDSNVVGALRAGSTTQFLPETGAQNEKAPSVSRRGLEIRVVRLSSERAHLENPTGGFLGFFRARDDEIHGGEETSPRRALL